MSSRSYKNLSATSFLLVKPSDWAKLDIATPSSFQFLYGEDPVPGRTQSILTSKIFTAARDASSRDRCLWVSSEYGEVMASVGDTIEVKTDLDSIEIDEFCWEQYSSKSSTGQLIQSFVGIIDFVWCAGSKNESKVKSKFIPNTNCQDHFCNRSKSTMSRSSKIIVNFLT